MSQSQIFLIDAHALCYRAFYAVPELTNSKGQPTNAVFGFTNILRKLIKTHNPRYMAVCFDTKAPTKRAERYAEYKIQRPRMPESLSSQIPLIRDVIKAYGVPIFEKDGYEADDVIATLAVRLKSEEREVVIVSDDKDMFQLVDKNVRMYSTRKEQFFGIPETEEKFGFAPQFISDWIGLAGDSSDNIPGIRGIGPGTAKKLINQFGDLEAILAHVDEVKGEKLKESLREHADLARMSKELAVLETDVDVDVREDDILLNDPDQKHLLAIFQELEFNRWVDELQGDEPKTESKPAKALTIHEGADAFKQAVSSLKTFSVHWDAEQERLCLGSPEAVWTVGVDEISVVKDVLNKSDGVVAYGIKALNKQLAQWNVHITGNFFDVILAGYVLSSSVSSFALKTLAWTYLKESFDETSGAVGEAALLTRLEPVMRKALKDGGVDDVYQTIERPLAEVLFAMEREGVCVDVKCLEELSAICTEKIEELKKDIFGLAGEEFNINSPKQLGVVLFEKLKLPPVKKTKTGFSTNEEVLVKLAARHPLPEKILDYRQLTKLQSTYIDALPKLIDPQTGRIHATFNQAGAETGRLSSTQPNLQNIPIRTELGRRVRQAFIPSTKERVLLSADYSQIELRILAHLAKEERLIKAFQDDEDIHAYTAGLIFDVPEDKVDSSMRNAAKRVNFGIIYGISAFGLSKDLNVSIPEAQDFIDRYFLRYPGVKVFMDEQIELAEKYGYVETILKRRRYIPEIHSRNNAVKQFAQRQAINTPVQGAAADLIKLAMIAIDRDIRERKLQSRMISTVHDELIFDITPNERNDMIQLVQTQMEGQMKLDVPIKASVKIGPNWMDMKPV